MDERKARTQGHAGAGGPVAVLVLAYGGPKHLDEVRPFLDRVLAPRVPTAQMIERALGRYQAIGGGSPLAENTFAQASALDAYLRGPGATGLAGSDGAAPEVGTFVGMRFTEPTISRAVEQALDFGRGRAVAVILASHQSARATGGYVAGVEAACSALGDLSPGRVRFVGRWHAAPLFLEAVAERVREVLPPSDDLERNDRSVLFTAHSLPMDAGERDTDYESALLETARGVMGRVGHLPWRLAYQSRSDRPGVEWLGPDAADALAEEAAAGRREVVVVPLGFVSEHLETLYDLDVALAGRAAELGLGFRRARTVQDEPRFIAALAASVTQRVIEAGGEAA
jgi:protoporphyrin/coproporphyrin ferrochelatase